MSRRSRSVVVTAVIALCAAASPAWADLKIGVVQYARLMQESPQAKAVQEALRAEFASKQRELNTEQQTLNSKEAELRRDQATMTADQLNAAQQQLRDGTRELNERVNEYQDDFNARQNLEMSKVAKVVVEQVQRYAQAQRFDLVLADGVIWANPTIDITQPILQALQAASTTSGPTRSGTSRSRK